MRHSLSVSNPKFDHSTTSNNNTPSPFKHLSSVSNTILKSLRTSLQRRPSNMPKIRLDLLKDCGARCGREPLCLSGHKLYDNGKRTSPPCIACFKGESEDGREIRIQGCDEGCKLGLWCTDCSRFCKGMKLHKTESGDEYEFVQDFDLLKRDPKRYLSIVALVFPGYFRDTLMRCLDGGMLTSVQDMEHLLGACCLRDDVALVNVLLAGSMPNSARKDALLERLAAKVSGNPVDPAVLNNAPICAAAAMGSLHVVRRLMQDPRVDPSVDGNRPVRLASMYGFTSVVEALLTNPNVDPSADDNFALCEASDADVLALVEVLLNDPRVAPNARDDYPLGAAALNGNLTMVKRLLDSESVNPCANDNYAIRMTAAGGSEEVYDVLLPLEGVDPSAHDNDAIALAAQNGEEGMVVKLLRDERVDPSGNNNLAVRLAAQNGHAKIVEMLLRVERVDPSADDNYAIRWAAKNGHTNVVEILLQASRVDPAANWSEALGNACWSGDIRMVEFFLRDGRADPNDAKAVYHATPHFDIVKLLLQNPRVDPSVRGNAALDSAACDGNLRVVEMLLQDPRVSTADMDSMCLISASSAGHVDVVKRLLEDPRTDPTTRDFYALRRAAHNGYSDVVERLLQDPRVDPSSGDYTVLHDVACELPLHPRGTRVGGYSKIVQMLIADPRVTGDLYIVERLGERFPELSRLVLSKPATFTKVMFTKPVAPQRGDPYDVLGKEMIDRLAHEFTQSVAVGAICISSILNEDLQREVLEGFCGFFPFQPFKAASFEIPVRPRR